MVTSGRMNGPDRGWSWVVAAACFFSSLVLAGIFRTSGVLFVAFIHSFGVTREEASWPMVLCISVLNLTGPFSGVLGQKFGARPVIMTGALIATIGVSACFFTTSLEVITLFFGGVFGVGWGLINTLMPGVLNAYFLNLRATANGIANSGSCFGSLILPVVFEYFISVYGLSGCFLLTGGIVSHIAISGALMRPPSWQHDNETVIAKCSFQEANKCQVELDPMERNTALLTSQNNISAQSALGKDLTTVSNAHSIQQTLSPKESSATLEEHTKHISCFKACPRSLSSELTSRLKPSLHTTHAGDGLTISERKTANSIKTSITNNKFYVGNKSKSFWSIFQHFATVLTCPMFYVTAITNVSFYFLYHMYVVVIVDYALDRRVPAGNAKDMLFAFSIADLFGRLCFGWITDRKFVTRSKFVMICMIMIGVVFFMFPFSTEYWSLIAVSCCYGLLLGCTMVIFPILLVDFLGIELHAVSYGCMCFMNGFASFGRPFLIGYFRDHMGSYSNMFYVLGGISVTASLLWMLEDFFAGRQKLHQQL